MTATPDAIRVDLVDEAIRLTRLLAELAPGHPEVRGLLALELYTAARTAARLDHDGALVPLAEQDRSRWDLDRIVEANRLVAEAMAANAPGPYQLQAVVAATHANARTAADTDWPRIATLLGQLHAMTGSPVVALNHAIAIAEADGPDRGLARLDEVDGLDGYHLLHAGRAELLRRAGRGAAAVPHLERALALTANLAERRLLERRLAEARAVAGDR